MGGVDEGMSIHEVLHRSVLEVDEEGEAAPTVPATFQISCAAKVKHRLQCGFTDFLAVFSAQISVLIGHS